MAMIKPVGLQPMGGAKTPGSARVQEQPINSEEKGGIQEHYDKATSVCGHIDDLVAALTELYEDNAKWKSKYISTKKAHFSKFFGASSTMLLGSTFREWKAWTHEQTAARKYDAMRMEQEIAEREWNLKLENQEKEHDKRLQALEANHKLAIAELSEQIAQRNTELSKLEAEKDSVFGKGEKSYKVLQSLKHQLEALDDEEFAVTSAHRPAPVSTNSFDFLKNRLHDLLNQVDPKYVPPLGSLSLMPPPQPLSGSIGHHGSAVISSTATQPQYTYQFSAK
ncbi:unnamed protein product [Amoebophrya sp. A120]|nr:unnamed protein product [Amoebophrya sp. A120]|eukprot:GSA120T00000802001.1